MEIIKQEKGVYFFEGTKNGRINFFLTFNYNTFRDSDIFLLCNEKMEPSFHFSVRSVENNYFITVGRYCKETDGWVHMISYEKLELNKKYLIETHFGIRNEIIIDDIVEKFNDKKFIFYNEKSNYIQFGDKRVDSSFFNIENFSVRDIYGNNKNTDIFHVSEPKKLD